MRKSSFQEGHWLLQSRALTCEGDYPDLGYRWLSEEGMHSILSFLMVEYWSIEYIDHNLFDIWERTSTHYYLNAFFSFLFWGLTPHCAQGSLLMGLFDLFMNWSFRFSLFRFLIGLLFDWVVCLFCCVNSLLILLGINSLLAIWYIEISQILVSFLYFFWYFHLSPTHFCSIFCPVAEQQLLKPQLSVLFQLLPYYTRYFIFTNSTSKRITLLIFFKITYANPCLVIYWNLMGASC